MVTPLGPLTVYEAWVFAWSVVAFAVCAWDKARAARGRGRVRERTLLGLAAAGGSPGLAVGMLLVRHKTRKARFIAAFAAIVVAQAAVAWLLLR